MIGHANKGKSTVLKTLRGDKMTKEILGATEEKRGGKGEREREREKYFLFLNAYLFLKCTFFIYDSCLFSLSFL